MLDKAMPYDLSVFIPQIIGQHLARDRLIIYDRMRKRAANSGILDMAGRFRTEHNGRWRFGWRRGPPREPCQDASI